MYMSIKRYINLDNYPLRLPENRLTKTAAMLLPYEIGKICDYPSCLYCEPKAISY